MLDSSSFIPVATEELRRQQEVSKRLAKIPEGISFDDLSKANDKTKRDYHWPSILHDKWKLRYGFPPIMLVVGSQEQTKELITKLKTFVLERCWDVEFKTISMVELIANGGRPIPSPKGKNGGYIVLHYQDGLTDETIYDLTKHILMNENTEEDSVYKGFKEDQNWREEVHHCEEDHVMPWIRSGWSLIVVADTQATKSFQNRIYYDLFKRYKWYEFMA